MFSSSVVYVKKYDFFVENELFYFTEHNTYKLIFFYTC